MYLCAHSKKVVFDILNRGKRREESIFFNDLRDSSLRSERPVIPFLRRRICFLMSPNLNLTAMGQDLRDFSFKIRKVDFKYGISIRRPRRSEFYTTLLRGNGNC